jgi:hypothetical protein
MTDQFQTILNHARFILANASAKDNYTPCYTVAMASSFDWIAYAIETGNESLAYCQTKIMIKHIRTQQVKNLDPIW